MALENYLLVISFMYSNSPPLPPLFVAHHRMIIRSTFTCSVLYATKIDNIACDTNYKDQWISSDSTKRVCLAFINFSVDGWSLCPFLSRLGAILIYIPTQHLHTSTSI